MSLNSKVKHVINLLRTEKKVPIPQPMNTQRLLEGKVALITGGSGGIGYAMAEAFLKGGAKVIIAGTSETKLKGCCERLKTAVDKATVVDATNTQNQSWGGYTGHRISCINYFFGQLTVYRAECA